MIQQYDLSSYPSVAISRAVDDRRGRDFKLLQLRHVVYVVSERRVTECHINGRFCTLNEIHQRLNCV